MKKLTLILGVYLLLSSCAKEEEKTYCAVCFFTDSNQEILEIKMDTFLTGLGADIGDMPGNPCGSSSEVNTFISYLDTSSFWNYVTLFLGNTGASCAKREQ